MKTALHCPKCEIDMKVVLHEDVEVDACEKCKGVWVERLDEKKVLQMKPEIFTVDEIRQLRKYYEPLGKSEPVRYVKCPSCRELMQRKVWGSHSGIVVDKCKDHGTWFDAGELEKVREFVALGGVELEKLKLAEKGINQVNRRVSAEVARLDKKIDDRYWRARFWSMLGF